MLANVKQLVYIFFFLVCVTGNKVNICSGDYSEKTLHCKSGNITIKEAFYGRRTPYTCDDGSVWFTTCEQSLLDLVSAKCTGQATCGVNSTEVLHSLVDKCDIIPNKYIGIEYECSSSTTTTKTEKSFPEYLTQANKTTTICQYEQNSLSCNDQQQIIIKSVFWGRDDDKTCLNHWTLSTSSMNTSCRLDTGDVLMKLKRFCTGTRLCPLFAHEEWIGETCKETSKYLRVNYYCEDKSMTTDKPYTTTTTTTTKITTSETATTTKTPVHKTKILCEPYDDFIFCFPSYFHAVSASYGRTDNPQKCNGAENSTSPTTTNCSTDALKVVSFCNNKQACVISSKAGQYGDPCPGVKKYLNLTYYCGPLVGQPATTPFIPIVPTANLLPSRSPANVTCGKPTSNSPRVINGNYANRGAWPWQVAIYKKDGSFICGGSILTPLWIVTAAHCFRGDEDKDNYYVVLGDTDRSVIEGSEIRYNLNTLISHKSWNKPILHDNDIAMLEIDRPVIFNQYISPVCLPGNTTKAVVGEECVITGWGKTDYPGYSSIKLKQARLSIVSQQNCQNKLSSAPGQPGTNITANMLCANSIDATIRQGGCQGDSGGPFVCLNKDEWTLKGIVSWGSPRYIICGVSQEKGAI